MFNEGYDELEIHMNNRRQQVEIQVKEINIRYNMNNLFASKRSEPDYIKYLEEELINTKIELMKATMPQVVEKPVPKINADDFELPMINADDLF